MPELAGLTRLSQAGTVEEIVRSDDLAEFRALGRRRAEEGKPLAVIGCGSKTVFAARHFAGTVVVPENRELSVDSHGFLAGAGWTLGSLHRALKNEGIANLDLLFTIPGTLGGSLALQAGFLEDSIYDHLEYVEGLTYAGTEERVYRDELEYGYRRTDIRSYLALIWRARFRAVFADSKTVTAAEMRALAVRKGQPHGRHTLGSAFKNTGRRKARSVLADISFTSPAFALDHKNPNFPIFKPNLEGPLIVGELQRFARVAARERGILLQPEIVII